MVHFPYVLATDLEDLRFRLRTMVRSTDQQPDKPAARQRKDPQAQIIRPDVPSPFAARRKGGSSAWADRQLRHLDRIVWVDNLECPAFDGVSVTPRSPHWKPQDHDARSPYGAARTSAYGASTGGILGPSAHLVWVRLF